jgi:cephalosporin hydroxylase
MRRRYCDEATTNGKAPNAIMTMKERYILSSTVRALPPHLHGHDILEIGAGVGGSAVLMARALRDCGKVRSSSGRESKIYTVDACIMVSRSRKAGAKNWVSDRTNGEFTDQRTAIQHAIAGYPRIQFIESKSEDLLRSWPEHHKIALLVIDGSHFYQDVLRDMGWLQYVEVGGFAVFHDFGGLLPASGFGVTEAFAEWFAESPNWRWFLQRDSILTIQRIE